MVYPADGHKREFVLLQTEMRHALPHLGFFLSKTAEDAPSCVYRS